MIWIYYVIIISIDLNQYQTYMQYISEHQSWVAD